MGSILDGYEPDALKIERPEIPIPLFNQIVGFLETEFPNDCAEILLQGGPEANAKATRRAVELETVKKILRSLEPSAPVPTKEEPGRLQLR